MAARRKLTLDAAIAVGIAAAVLAITAIAHSDGEAYPTKWERKNTVVYRFDSKLPGGKFRSRIVKAGKQWSRLDASLAFKKAKGKGNPYPESECGSRYQDNVLTERKLGGPLAVTTWCTFADSSEIYSFQIGFEKGIDWYTGSGKPNPGTSDLFSATLHEFGHASGRSDHYRDGAAECEGDDAHVMCATIAEGDTLHIEAHDKHTFEAAY